MKLLIVEDDEDNISLFETELGASTTCKPTFARSRESALTALAAASFDMVVLDLKIPTKDGGLDSDVNHGLAVHSYVQENSYGTPIVVFSAYGTVKLAIKLAENSERNDTWGCGQEEPMTLYKEKSDFVECLAHINRAIEHVDSLAKINLSTGGKVVNLTSEQKRVLRIYSRLHHGTNAMISSLGGGLSNAKTVRLEVQDEHGATTTVALAKLGALKDLRDEETRYHQCIAPCLSVGGFAHLIKFLRAGAANAGGIFYGFAGDYPQSLSDVLQANPAKACLTVGHLRRLENDWHSNAVPKLITVGEIRRSLVSDSDVDLFAGRLGFDWQTIERMQINLKWCCQHRDLHCSNVLVRDDETPLLIDYGEVGRGPACLDPIILELSLLFHPAFKDIRGTWPTATQAQSWTDLDRYLSGCSIAAFVKACREWAFAVEPLDKGVYATAYAFAVRQLKFTGTDHELAVSIARAAQARLIAD